MDLDPVLEGLAAPAPAGRNCLLVFPGPVGVILFFLTAAEAEAAAARWAASHEPGADA